MSKSFDCLIKKAKTLEFAKKELSRSSYPGYMCESANEAIELIGSMFSDVKREIQNHPEYPSRISDVARLY
jgi:hypothetical protein